MQKPLWNGSNFPVPTLHNLSFKSLIMGLCESDFSTLSFASSYMAVWFFLWNRAPKEMVPSGKSHSSVTISNVYRKKATNITMSHIGNVYPSMLWHVCENQAFIPSQMSDTSDKEDKNLLSGNCGISLCLSNTSKLVSQRQPVHEYLLKNQRM